ncbi:MGMT family protein [Mesobacillus sp. AQ2]|jgi:methylated-DNA-protein-cysteine methyltransferase related protein|uniref:MGMT family protein n=1 Tax=unclassified Mesobacillus TaxID=2675270 RepID=UPI00204065B2|nr:MULTISPECIES: MGMT family protein [unclassified Mesobacillus]MCM3121774.1 MGMT family protein [Mesobacillus sp. MER 33]MCM3231738.1 MGMT family protein [Mesobacillus sp. MER 48]WHX38706.1 MGMT family protein [Mesobacillus sp. AQ2]
MTQFTKNVINIIKNIPSGKVMTYGQIAKAAGSPRAARQVVRILHSMSEKYNLPWHRVINSKGEIGFKDEEMFQTQKSLLISEGVQFKSDRAISLLVYLWDIDWEFGEQP